MSQSSIRWALAVGLAVLVAAGYYLSRPTYGKVSRFGYDITLALESACSRQDDKRVASIREMLDQREEISDRERQWICEILASAEAGSWDDARSMARELMRAQVVSRANRPRSSAQLHTH